MGRRSGIGMSGVLITPGSRAEIARREAHARHVAAFDALVNEHALPGESFQDTCLRLESMGLIRKRYPRGREPVMSKDEQIRLAAEAVSKRGVKAD